MKFRYRKFFKVTGLIVSGIIGLALFLLLVGFIVDLAIYPALSKKGKAALNYLVSFRKEGKDNAWNYYAEAEKKVKDAESYYGDEGLKETTGNYLDGKIAIIPEILKAIETNKDAIEIMKQGTKQAFCSIPYEYEKGAEMKVPRFLELQLVSSLLCARALYELKKGGKDEALDDALSVCIFGKDLASGGPIVMGNIVGVIQIERALKVIGIGFSSGVFGQKEMGLIFPVLNKTEKDWPYWSWAWDGNMKLGSITFGKIPFYKGIECLWRG